MAAGFFFFSGDAAPQCKFVVAQGGNFHLVRSAAVAAEMEFATRWWYSKTLLVTVGRSCRCGGDGAVQICVSTVMEVLQRQW